MFQDLLVFLHPENHSGEKMERSIHDMTEVAKQIQPLWQPLTDEQRQAFAGALEVYTYERGECIFQQGQVPCYLYYLLSGHVTIYQEGIGGRSQVIRMVEPNATFGYYASFNQEPYQSTAIAGSDIIVATLPLSMVFHLIWENNAFAMIFIKELSALLGTSINRTINLTQKRIRARLADSLIAIRNRYGFDANNKTLAIALSRNDLAQMSNMTTSNAIRTLSTFAQEGLVAIEGRKISLLDIKALERISEEKE